jgi:ribose 5-phosphate isomerase A
MDEHLKAQAAARAVDCVRSGMRVGLGSGSTAAHVVRELGRRVRAGRLEGVVGVPTSEAIEQLAREEGLAVETLDARPIELAIDGADEIDPTLDLLKGRGGALLREKLVALSAREFLIVADHSKRVDQLGSMTPLPLEVVPFGHAATLARLAATGGTPVLRVADGVPVRSDGGNLLVNLCFAGIEDPAALAAHLKAMPGVVEHGLFLGMATRAFVAYPDGVRELVREG